MGLDMYLYRKAYTPAQFNHADCTVTLSGKDAPVHVDPKKILWVLEEVGYWRKANHIHNWFVQHVQDGNDDCKEYPVSLDTLRELQSVVATVLDDPSMGPQLLPTTDGFFFGSTEYAQGYVDDLQLTMEIIKHVLDTDNHDIYSYKSSW